MDVTPAQIEEFFERYGWAYSRESETTWITGVRTRVSAFRIMVRLTEHWVFFIINPLVVAPTRARDRMRVYYHALRYNLDMNFAKLGVDSDGDVFMAVELPTENFQYSHFMDALDGLSHHATSIYTELFGLAHNPQQTVGRYDPELEQSAAADDEISSRRMPRRRVEDDKNDPVDDSDIIIAGRRLKIFDGEDGEARVELENEEEDKSEAPKKRKPRKRKDSDSE
jgi:hypothetical protein